MLNKTRVRDAYLVISNPAKGTVVNCAGPADHDQVEAFVKAAEGGAIGLKVVTQGSFATSVTISGEFSPEWFETLVETLRSTSYPPECVVAFELWKKAGGENGRMLAALVTSLSKIFSVSGATLPGWRGLTLDGRDVVKFERERILLDREWFTSAEGRLDDGLAFVRVTEE